MGDDLAVLPTQEPDGVNSAPAGTIAVVGGGSIGVAWAIVFARANHEVRVYDVDAARTAAVLKEVAERAVELATFGLIDDPDAVVGRVTVHRELAPAVRGAFYVQECVAERVDVKRAVFAELDAVVAADAVLASSSSMIPCSRFATGLAGRARCLVVHPGNPPYLLPVAELVPAPFTDADTVERAAALLTAAGMTPVRVAVEVEGFVYNRLQGALLREAYCLVRDGVVSASDVDRVVRLGLGRRWSVIGPFATAELNTRGGLTRHAQVMGPAYARMGAERGQRDEWSPDLVALAAEDIHAELPADDWAENVLRRDRALMVLEAARQAAGPVGPHR